MTYFPFHPVTFPESGSKNRNYCNPVITASLEPLHALNDNPSTGNASSAGS
jgi:hypothetical protein